MSQDKTHWLSNPNKNYLGHWDLPEDKDLVLTIKKAGFEEVENPAKSTKNNPHIEVKKVVHWVENYKPMIINAVNADRIYKSIKIRNMEDSSGKKLALYVAQEKFRFSKELIDCIRIRPIPYVKPAEIKKPSIGDKRFKEALKQINEGNYTVKELKEKVSLSPEQLKQLPNG